MVNIKNKMFKAVGSVLAAVAFTLILLPGANTSAATKDIDIKASDYGYGEYIVTARGVGYDGVYDEDLIRFYYYPVYGELVKDNDHNGKYTVNLDYNTEEGSSEEPGGVASVVINIVDKDGNPVGPSPITVNAPDKTVDFDLSEYDIPSGTYTVEITAYDKDGVKLYKTIVIGEIVYEEEVIPVPDTGGILGNLNISKTDYLITGLMIFFLVGIGGALFIAKRGKKTSRRRK